MLQALSSRETSDPGYQAKRKSPVDETEDGGVARFWGAVEVRSGENQGDYDSESKQRKPDG